jgi:ethanolamine ammonia-lyase large subunit
MSYQHSIGIRSYRFADLRELMAKASPARSGDYLAGVAAGTEEERMAAKIALAGVPLKRFLEEELIPYDEDEVTRLIFDEHDAIAFTSISHLTVGDFRNWLLSDLADSEILARIAPGVTPEMAAAVSKIMRNQDLILAAQSAGSSPASAIPSACPGGSPSASSRITPPTMPKASPPPCSMGCSTAAAMR